MAGYKETPRQKMIGMMYLVLTALLALNVSKDVLDSFLVVNESMETTNKKFAGTVEETYEEFREQYLIQKEKAGPFWEKAQKAQELSAEMVQYIDSIKYLAIAKTEGITVEEAKVTPLSKIHKKDDYDSPTNFFIGLDIKKGASYHLKERIEEYKAAMKKLLSENARESLNLGLKTDGEYWDADQKVSWERHHFYHTILAADVTILNKLITEVYNAELDVVNHLYSSISAEDFKFDDIAAKVIPNSNYVFVGDKYTAEILVAAYDTTQNPKVYIRQGLDSITDNNLANAMEIKGEGGMAKLELPATKVGTQKYAGIIKMISPLGDTNIYHFKDQFIVAEPSATVSPTKMNVFYKGVDNPISIAASGKANSEIHPEITKGRIIRDPENGWIVNNIPGNYYDDVVVKIWADDNGGRKLMGQQTFRVKDLPDPIAKIYGTSPDGTIAKKALLVNPYLSCKLPDYVDFKFDFDVLSFTMATVGRDGYIVREKSGNQYFTDKMKRLIENARSDDIIIFQDINVQGPTRKRRIENITINIK